MARPLFRPDPGWLWLIAGLVVVFVATVVPAQLSLERDRAALRQLQAAETRTFELLAAHDRFLADLREGHPPLLRRLAASNLNRMPADHEAVLLAESIDDHPIRWLEASVPAPVSDSVVQAPSLLETLVSGRSRLWVVGFGLLCLFVGLLLAPMRGRAEATRRLSSVAPAPSDRSESKRSADDASRWRPVKVPSIAVAGGSLAAAELPTTTSSLAEEEFEGVTDAETDDAEIEDAAEEFAEDEEDDAEVEDAEGVLEDEEEDAEDEDGEEDLEDEEEDAEDEDVEEELEDEEEDAEDEDGEEDLEEDDEEDETAPEPLASQGEISPSRDDGQGQRKSRLVTREEIHDLLAPAEDVCEPPTDADSVPVSEFVIDPSERDEWIEEDAETAWR